MPECIFHLLRADQKIRNVLIAERVSWEIEGNTHVLSLSFPQAQKIAGSSLAVSHSECHIVNENDKKKFLKEIVSAIHDLHKRNIAHRDIKPENIMYYQNSYVLIDFGLAHLDTTMREEGHFTTPWYRSPELLQNNYLFPCPGDIWAAAISYLHLFYNISLWKYDQAAEQWRGKNKLEDFQSMVIMASLSIFLDKLLLPISLDEAKALHRCTLETGRDPRNRYENRCKVQRIVNTIIGTPENTGADFSAEYIKNRLLTFFGTDKQPSQMSEKEAELLAGMMGFWPEDRFTASEILEHSFLDGI